MATSLRLVDLASLLTGSGHVGWVMYDPKLGDIETFLDNNKPTSVTSIAAPWISVSSPSHEKKPNAKDEIEDDLKDSIAQAMFKEKCELGRKLTADDITEIAKATGYVSGKWLIYRSPERIDSEWKKIARATYDGKLGTSCKVSTAGQVGEGKMHVICVYTEDYTDQVDAYKVEQGLREIGILGTMSYKPDIYTSLNIYANNKWKLRATVYTSKKT